MTPLTNPSVARKWWPAAVTVLACIPWTVSAAAETRPEPRNQVVIILDASGSFSERAMEALERATRLLDDISETKVKRWETDPDFITIISLDASPDVIWNGTLRDLKKMDAKEWTNRFKARKDYAHCTDVTAAFRLAAKALDGDPKYTDKYLFAFTDLVHEPPTRSIRRCKRPQNPSGPPADFPWEALKGVHVSVLWLPPEQKHAWRAEVEAHGLADVFGLYTESESADVKLLPPPRPQEKVTEKERVQRREEAMTKVKEWAGQVGIFVAWVAGVLVLLLAAGLIRRRFRRQAPRMRPDARNPIPPLRLPPRPGGNGRFAPTRTAATRFQGPPRDGQPN